MLKPVFKEYNQQQMTLFPQRLDERISADSPVRLINQIVDNLDITAVEKTYKGGGTSGYHPRMMLKVLFYAYMNNIYSCRKIHKLLLENIHYMWLSGNQTPDYRTINNFRSLHLKGKINKLFTQVVILLVEMGYITLQTVYIDGTKMESRANRYTFVWRKSVEKNRVKLEAKIRKVLEMIEEGIAQDNLPDEEPPTPINSDELKKKIAEINRENLSKEEKTAVKTLENKYLPKLQEYETKLEKLGNRNSYSKTDESATFMRLKDDHMQNGQLKPAYNLQIGTENQFITHYDFFSNPTDTRTMIPFFNNWKNNYQKMPKIAVADAGYGSEENYEYMENAHIQAFVKYNYFHAEQKKKFRENIFLTQNLFYNEKYDYFVCPMGQHLEKKHVTTKTNEYGYKSEITVYEAQNCEKCPLKCLCFKAKGNRKIEINHNLRRLKNKARELLHSEEGIAHRKRRCCEPEPVFSHIRYNGQYLRLRHFGQQKVEMDFGIFAIALNIKKMHKKWAKSAKNHNQNQKDAKSTKTYLLLLFLYEKKTYTQTKTLKIAA